jgi:hypothetical protein
MNSLLVTAADLLRYLDGNTVKVVVVLALTLALRVLIKTFAKQTPSVRRDLVEIARIYFNRKKKKKN